MMKSAKAAATLGMVLLSIGIGWLMLGWWMLAFVVIGLAWQLIKDQSGPPSTSHYKPPAKPTIYPPPTGPTWQETVERIEAARASVAGRKDA